MYLILVLLIAVAVVMVVQPWKRRGCRWREDRRALADGRVLHHCLACGAQIALPKGRAPATCLADQRGT